MLDYRSDTFRQTRSELAAMKEDLASRNIPMEKQHIIDFLKQRNIDPKEFVQVNKEFSAARTRGEDVSPEGFRIGRIAAGAVGEVGRDIKGIASAIAPETTEAISEKISSIIPDPWEKRIGSFFDPDFGEGTGSEVDRVVSEIASFFVPSTFAVKAIGKGSKFIKVGKGLGPKARRLRRIGRSGKYGIGGSLGYTISEDSADENMVNVLLEGAELVGMEKSMLANILNKIAVNPEDPIAQQKLNSFLNNLALAGTGIASVTLAKKIIQGAKNVKGVSSLDYGTAQIVNKIVKKNKLNKSKQTQIDSTPLSKMGKIKNKWLKGLLPDRGTDAFTLERILFRENAGGKAIEEIEGLVGSLTRAVFQASKYGKFNKQQIDDKIQVILETGDKAALAELKLHTPEVYKIVTRMRKNMNNIRGNVSKHIKDEELKLIYNPKTKEVYFNRAYRIFDDPSFSKEIKDIPPNVRKDIENFLRSPEGGNIADEDMIPAIKALLNVKPGQTDKKLIEVLMGADGIKGKGGFGLGSSKTFKKRKMDKLPEIRALWGEIKDPYKTYSRTYQKLAKIESEASFLDDMSKYLKSIGAAVDEKTFLQAEGIVSKNFEEATNLGEEVLTKVFGQGARGTYTKGGKRKASKNILNPLEGLYLNKNYKNFIEQGTDILGPQSGFMKNWMRYKVASQTAKTVYNPATHGRNTMGNMVLLVANGMNPFRSGSESFEAAFKKLTGYSNETIGKRLGRYKELGITDSGVRQETLKRTAGQVFNFNSKTVLGKVSKGMDSRKNPLKTAHNLYQVEDDFFKVMHFEKTLKDLKKVFPKGTPLDTIEREAARRTRNLMPNYGLVGKHLKELRYLPVGDFIAFPAEMVRVSYNLGKQTLDDISGKTAQQLGVRGSKARKELKNMGYRRLAGMTVAGTAGEQAMMYSANRLGITPEQRKAVETLSPPYAMGSPKIFLSQVDIDKNNHVGIDYINLGPIDPFNYLKAPAMLLGGELLNMSSTFSKTGKIIPSENFDAKYKAALVQALGPFLGTSMATDALIDAIGASKDPTLTMAERGSKISEALIDTITPGGLAMFQKGQKYRVSKELREDMGLGAVSDYDYTIPEVEMEGALSKWKWFGVRPQRVDITAGMRRQIFPLTKGMDDKKYMVDFMNNPNAPRAGPERNKQFIEAYINDQKKRISNHRKLKRIADAYNHLGIDYEEILRGLSKDFLRTINGEDVITKLDAASNNKFMPSFIPENLMPYAQEYTGGDLPYEYIGKLYENLYEQNLSKEY